MNQLRNRETQRESAEVARLQDGVDKLPSLISDNVQLVAEVNPKMMRRCNIVRNVEVANATSGTLYTVPSTGEFYLHAAQLSLIKDATSTSIKSYLQITPYQGAATRIISFATLTLTAQTLSESVVLTCPVRLEPGSSVLVVNGTNVANITAHGCIAGYLLQS